MKEEELLKAARQRAKDEFNNLPFETRKKLANGYERLLEINLILSKGDILNMEFLINRKRELESWLLDWYREIDKSEK